MSISGTYMFCVCGFRFLSWVAFSLDMGGQNKHTSGFANPTVKYSAEIRHHLLDQLTIREGGEEQEEEEDGKSPDKYNWVRASEKQKKRLDRMTERQKIFAQLQIFLGKNSVGIKASCCMMDWPV